MAHRNFDQEKRLNAIETFKMDKSVLSVTSPFLKNQMKRHIGTLKRHMNAWRPLN